MRRDVWDWFEVMLIGCIVFAGAYIMTPIAAFLWAQFKGDEEPKPVEPQQEPEEPSEWDKLSDEEREELRRYFRM